MSFDCYCVLITRKVFEKVDFEYWDVMPFLSWCELLGWECCDEKIHNSVVLSIVRIIRMNKVPLRTNKLSCDYVQ